ncbi:DUF5694 domain-containing protein [Sphingomonas sp. CFBP 13720]|uniref:DUF5694 domain-containing protein n=1 Tax=Sphingomonas sp. CFBP 13720 TaxID=2775302 RepID=UPI00177BD9B1|nr:DUF5694 domain-containing protein [Sphingomonas sp. CFBP 13720]MBD8678078.1 hypothetical protein [Sphingomonas sp. CFBP 13720]
MKIRFGIALLSMTAGLTGVGNAQSYQSSFRPDALKDRPAGRPNEVLVVGSPHLSTLPASFRTEMVEPLVRRLVAWRPTAVASENISGLQCDAMRRQRERQAEAVETYCYDPGAAGRAVGYDVPAANAEAEKMLSTWPATPSPAQRRRLALVLLAAGEPASALVQWLRLPKAERWVDDGLTTALAADLDARTIRKGETELVAAQLAARSGLERVWSVDDQSFVGAPIDEKAYGAAIARAWDNSATKTRIAEAETLGVGIGRPDGLLDMYRALNAPAKAALAYQSDWGAALTEPSPQAYGRRYVAYWETRNLRMAANIREVLGRAPGTRLIAIVGASHKPYYEAYLRQMRDVQLVDAEPVLR